MAVLLDIGARRREVDEEVEALGDSVASRSQIPDGLAPELRPLAGIAMQTVVRKPTWANILYAATIGTIANREDDDQLRALLVDTAQIAVSWIETIDERNKN